MSGNRISLVILAAGMGSRYGGNKQIDGVGPGGEIIMDYSIYDAVLSGFSEIIFVIRKELENYFKELIDKSKSVYPDVSFKYVFQDLDVSGFISKSNLNLKKESSKRIKPWGTGHALLVAKDLIKNNFAVINSDDFYGRDAFAVLGDYLLNNLDNGRGDLNRSENAEIENGLMVSFDLLRTLSENGEVNRGFCKIQDGKLVSIEECTNIYKNNDDKICATSSLGKKIMALEDTQVSMNVWGFSNNILSKLENEFINFLNIHYNSEYEEFFLPFFIDSLIKEKKIRVEVRKTTSNWMGITYREDLHNFKNKIQKMHESGIYPKGFMRK